MSDRTRQQYPRSQPYYPPRDFAAQEARLRRWTLMLVVGAAGALALTIALGFFFTAKARSRGQEVATPPESAESLRGHPPPLSDLAPPPPPRIPLVNAGARSMPRAVEPLPGEPRPIPPAVDATPKGPAELPLPPAPDLRVPYERALQSLGGLTGSHLYQTYLNIGLLADLVEADVYSEEDARPLLAAMTGLMELADQQFLRLAEAGLSPDDQKALERTRRVTALMRTQTKELTAYWQTNDKAHAESFQKARAEAWAGIKELLNIQE